jgi:predicted phosphodiesterase
MTLIGLISDVHAAPEPVAEALAIFSKAGVSQVLCAGDIAGYMDHLEETINLLIKNDCQTIMGNHVR